MTQKDLAKVLHVSDRAVSKWERGAGFPDVSLLEHLADALDLQVLDLLRGEEQEEAEPEVTVRRALVLLVRQAREKTRRRWGQILGTLAALAIVGFVLFGILDRAGVFLRPVSLTVTAAVYNPEGEMTGETTVTVDGERRILGDKSFVGRFAIDAVEPTCREEVTAPDSMGRHGRGRLAGYSVLSPRGILFPGCGADALYHRESAVLRIEAGGRYHHCHRSGLCAAADVGYYYSILPVFSNQF